jgi:predicted MFS family arabinose efflux permease
MATAYLACAIQPSAVVIVLACLAMGAGFVACHTTLQTRATEAAPAARGTAISLFAFSLFVGSAAGTVSFGYLADAVGYRRTFGLAGAGLTAFTIVVTLVLGRRTVRAAAGGAG